MIKAELIRSFVANTGGRGWSGQTTTRRRCRETDTSGNPVIAKPDRNSVLRAAITVAVLRDVLVEQGLNRNVVSLAVNASQHDSFGNATGQDEGV